MLEKHSEVFKGKSFPLGSSKTKKGVNFCVYSYHAHKVELHFFDHKNDSKPSQTFILDAENHNSYDYWHIEIANVQNGQLYGFKVHGDGTDGYCLDENKLLIDPYTKATAISDYYSRRKASVPGNNSKYSIKSIWIEHEEFNWEDDVTLNHTYADTVIYEVHVGGFTKNPNSKVTPKLQGTYLGMIEKIPYLKNLGITAVELLPLHQFDATDAPAGSNYWGYAPIAFFAPHNGYATNPDNGSAINEFKQLVKELHKAGIEVYLDVVFNHTAEGGRGGPILSFKGFGNKSYYILEEDGRKYHDFSGCGNSMNANHSVVRRLIIDCLHFWVQEMHIDGFRFDLASVLARDLDGSSLENPTLLWEIETDPILANTKIIAEAWDAAGLYQVGNFVGYKWAEWNGKFRDDIRKFLKGDENSIKSFTKRLMGSPDIYQKQKRALHKSINFVTCHDGFTLNDLVSYNTKYNMANGENNKDGASDNFSWNCGIEGPTTNVAIEELRIQQIKNFFVCTLLSLGTPMFWMGDEVRRSQKGNNNAYCQDSKTGWFDWDLVEENKDLFNFVRELIEFKHNNNNLWNNIKRHEYHEYLQWHGVELHQPDFGPKSHSISYSFTSKDNKHRFQAIINAFWKPLHFELTEPIADEWNVAINTSKNFDEINLNKKSAFPKIKVSARSIIILHSTI
jgi:glycogen operon protein